MADKVDNEKVEKTLDKIRKTINKASLNIPEILVMYGNLGYSLGASIAGFQGNGPTIEELNRSYYSNPTVDVGLMLQGLLITTWEEDFIKHPKISNLVKKEKG